MRRMKYKIGAFCLLAIGLWGCLEDKGVYITTSMWRLK